MDQLGRPTGLWGMNITAHQDDATQQPGPTADESQEQGLSRYLRQPQVEQHEIEVGLGENLIGRAGIGNRRDFITLAPEGALQRSPQGRLVVNDKNPSIHEATCVMGVRYRLVTIIRASSVESETRSSPAVAPNTARK